VGGDRALLDPPTGGDAELGAAPVHDGVIAPRLEMP
jgi:hypothetical protein